MLEDFCTHDSNLEGQPTESVGSSQETYLGDTLFSECHSGIPACGALTVEVESSTWPKPDRKKYNNLNKREE